MKQSFRIRRAIRRSLLACLLLVPGLAMAQTSGPLLDTDIPVATPGKRNRTVLERPRPELDPLGITAGGFRVYPVLGLEAGRTSNALGASAGAQGDVNLSLHPNVRIDSQWSRHALGAELDYDARRYAKVTAKNQNGWRVRADGRLDIHGESNLVASLSRERTYEDQYVGSFPANAGASIAVRQTAALIRGTLVANRLRLLASTDYTRFDYADSLTLAGAPLDQDYRDRKVYRTSIRAEALLAADSSAFVQLTYRRTRYDDRTSGPTDRTSRDYRIVAGLVADVTPVIRAAIGIGHARRTYDQAGLRTMRDVVADVRVDWNVTPLTTFSITGRRGIEEAIEPNAAGYVANRAGVRADHELLRTLLLNLSLERERDNFKGIGRRDRLIRVSAGAAYTMSRNVLITPRFEYARRRSEGAFPGPSFREVRFALRATLRI